ncbi:MAG TPA: hypothetical protein DCR40_08595 [Prolixibacteraceae bacterium]|nr:hypothetical protein [Prolixibacteraceae bacterium]
MVWQFSNWVITLIFARGVKITSCQFIWSSVILLYSIDEGENELRSYLEQNKFRFVVVMKEIFKELSIQPEISKKL